MTRCQRKETRCQRMESLPADDRIRCSGCKLSRQRKGGLAEAEPKKLKIF